MAGRDSFRLAERRDGFGIVGHEFGFESAEALQSAQSNPSDFFLLRRVGLVQTAFVAEPELLPVARLEHLHVTDLMDVVLDETVPLLRGSLECVTYELNAERVEGVVLPYRGIDFLFSELPLTNRYDFTCWRLPAVAADAPWPAIAGLTS